THSMVFAALLASFVAFALFRARSIRYRTTLPVRLHVSGNSEPRRTRRDDRWRSGSRILLAVREQSIFLAVETHSCVADCCPSVLRRSWICRAPKRTAVDLASGDPVRGAGVGIETHEISTYTCSQLKFLSAQQFISANGSATIWCSSSYTM